MLKNSQPRSFTFLMRTGLFFCFLLTALKCFSEDATVAGLVFDKDSRDRIASVNVRNITTGKSIYNNLKGEFKIGAKEGDLLIFSRFDYHPDTIKVETNAPLAIYMGRVAIQLNEVTIHDTLMSPEQRLQATRLDFTKIYGSLAYNDFLSSSPGGGAGLSIDALWNSLSRSGRNAAHLRELIESDYRQNEIDYRFNRNFVGKVTGLKDERLTEFMFRYRPGYYTTKNATEYEFITMIRANLRRFLRNNRRYTQQPLENNVAK